MKYVLISLYCGGDIGDRKWLVYGHVRAGHNESLGDPIEGKENALEFAHSYCVPVMIGCGSGVQSAVQKLTKPQ